MHETLCGWFQQGENTHVSCSVQTRQKAMPFFLCPASPPSAAIETQQTLPRDLSDISELACKPHPERYCETGS